MTDTISYIEMLRKLGAALGLPKPNVDQLVETQTKNIEAFGQSAQLVAQGAQSVAQKQRERMKAGLREAMAFARENQALGRVNANLAQQTEVARKIFEIAVKEAQETADTAQTCSRVHGRRHRAIDRGLLEPRCISLRDHSEDGASRYRRGGLSGKRRRRRRPLAAERPCRDGVGACRCVGRDVLGRAHGPFGRINLSVRGRAAEATLAAAYDALRQDRLGWVDGATGGGGR